MVNHAVCRRVLAAPFFALVICATAHADLKVVQEATTTGLPEAALAQAPQMASPTTITVYYKGSKSRTESSGTVSLSDLATGKVTVLDAGAKTYYLTAPSDALKGIQDNPMLAMLKFDTKVFVNPGSETQVLLGKSAHNFRYTAIMKMGMAGAGGGGMEGMAGMLPTVTIKGEEWVTDAITLPVSSTPAAQAGSMTKLFPPMLGKGLKEFADKMATIKGFPLRNTVTVTFAFPKNSPAAAQAPAPITTTITAKSISEEPLSDDLFVVPADYKQIDPPASGIPGSPPAAAPSPAP